MYLARYTWYDLGFTEQINKAQGIHFRMSWIFIQVISLGSIKGQRPNNGRISNIFRIARQGRRSLQFEWDQ